MSSAFTVSALQGVPRDVLQLISVACVLIAAKHEEVGPKPLNS